MSDPEFIQYAYWQIKSKPGNMTPGRDGVTLDGITNNYFIKQGKDIGSGTFTFKPARMIEISKAKGGSRPQSMA